MFLNTLRHPSLSEMFPQILPGELSHNFFFNFFSSQGWLYANYARLTALRPLVSPSHVTLSSPVHLQLNCSRVLSPGQTRASLPPADSPRWLLCAEDWLLPAADRPCVAYSFRCAHTSVHYVHVSVHVMHSYRWQNWSKQCNAYLIMHAIIFKPPLFSLASLLSILFVVFLLVSLAWTGWMQIF